MYELSNMVINNFKSTLNMIQKSSSVDKNSKKMLLEIVKPCINLVQDIAETPQML